MGRERLGTRLAPASSPGLTLKWELEAGTGTEVRNFAKYDA